MDLQNHSSFSSYSYKFAYLECHCSLFRTVRSKVSPWSVATLLSNSCTINSEKRAAKLHLAVFHAAAIWISNFWYPF